MIHIGNYVFIILYFPITFDLLSSTERLCHVNAVIGQSQIELVLKLIETINLFMFVPLWKTSVIYKLECFFDYQINYN